MQLARVSTIAILEGSLCSMWRLWSECGWSAVRALLRWLLQMIQHGCEADKADYDGRTALELACVKGHVEVRSCSMSERVGYSH